VDIIALWDKTAQTWKAILNGVLLRLSLGWVDPLIRLEIGVSKLYRTSVTRERSMFTRQLNCRNAIPMTFLGTWTNQHGSVLEIMSIDPVSGLIKGSYRTAVGNREAQGTHELTGYVKDKLIGFSVSYAASESVCCWTGRLESDGCIYTLWQLVGAKTFRKDEDSGQIGIVPSALWEAFHAQADIFKR
jgi:hypothetical protein